jgi:uncharacterized protein YacL
MLRNLARAFFTIVGISAGYGLGLLFETLGILEIVFGTAALDHITIIVVNISLAIILGVLFFLASSWMVNKVIRVAEQTEKELAVIPFNQMIAGAGGLIAGLVIAFLITPLLRNILGQNVLFTVTTVAFYTMLGYLGVRLGTRYLADPTRLSEYIKPMSSKVNTKVLSGGSAKILDTSVIIDGRIADISRTGFIEGELIVAEFVLEELRHIADSSDALKRTRGRRGLDVLNAIQKENNVKVRVTSEDFEDVHEVDIKLLKLAQKYGGAVVTNDFNLNKVAELQGVKVLNINDLANAVKPVVLPGEEMAIQVVKEGKENRQGIAYLDDGTMIVVEEGKRLIGEDIQVVVTSVLQTSAGRMIFAKPKGKYS